MPPRRAASPEPWEQGDDPALAYVMHQLGWYRRAMKRARRIHHAGELLILLSTAATVVVSALHAAAPVTASLAALALFLTGYRQVFNPNDRWVSSGVAWLALQQEAARYHLLPEADRDSSARRALLDRAIEIVSTENRAWADMRRAGPGTPPAVPGSDAPGT